MTRAPLHHQGTIASLQDQFILGKRLVLIDACKYFLGCSLCLVHLLELGGSEI